MLASRHAVWVVAGLATLSAVGCKTTRTPVPNGALTSGLPTPNDARPSMVSRMLNPTPAAPGPVKEAVISEALAQAGRQRGPIKPETTVAFADLQVEAAFGGEEDSSSNQERDKLLDEARHKYQRALSADPKNVEAMRGLARLYTRIGDRQRAAQMYAQLIQLAPTDHKMIYESALSHARFDDWQQATEVCRQAITADPENRRYQRTYGTCLARSGQFEPGFEAMMNVMSEAEARTTMGKIFADNDQHDAAKQQFQLAAAADPTFTAARDALAQYLPQRPAESTNPIQTVGYEQR